MTATGHLVLDANRYKNWIYLEIISASWEWEWTKIKLNDSGDRGSALPQRPRLAEDLRAVLRVENEEYYQQHRAEATSVPQHDVHLDRDVVPERLVGTLAPGQTEGKLETNNLCNSSNLRHFHLFNFEIREKNNFDKVLLTLRAVNSNSVTTCPPRGRSVQKRIL